MIKCFNVAAICGSLKRNSTSMGLIKACLPLNPFLNIEVIDIKNFPLFNQDNQHEKAPSVVKQQFQKVKKCDALLFSHPNSNSLVSSPLKNAYDWLSRGGQNAAVFKKPAAQMVTTFDPFVPYALQHLNQVVQYCQVSLMAEPNIHILTHETNYFDKEGNLVCPQIKGKLQQFLNHFVAHIQEHKK